MAQGSINRFHRDNSDFAIDFGISYSRNIVSHDNESESRPEFFPKSLERLMVTRLG